MKKRNTVIAIAVIFAIPALMLLQQFLMPRGTPPVPEHMFPRYDHRLYVATENALAYGDRRAATIALTAGLYIRSGDLVRGERWCRLGALEHRHPSIMVFYGDFLVAQKRFREGRRWYNFALRMAEKSNRSDFIRLVEMKLKAAAAREAER